MSDRLTRQEIKRDEVMEGLSRFVLFVTDNAKALVAGVAAVLALLAGYAVWQAVDERREATANAELAAALAAVAEPDADMASAAAQLEQVVQRHGATEAGSIAYAYLGTIAARGEDFDAAREHWQNFLRRHGDDALAAAVERNLIALDRSQGRSEELAARLRGTLASGDSALGEDTVLYELARTLEDLGQPDGALEIYSRLLDEHPTSVFVSEAQERTTALDAS